MAAAAVAADKVAGVAKAAAVGAADAAGAAVVVAAAAVVALHPLPVVVQRDRPSKSSGRARSQFRTLIP